jgi:hypothetical protein
LGACNASPKETKLTLKASGQAASPATSQITVAPASAAPGASITISGGNVSQATQVKFGSADPTKVSLTDGKITINVPEIQPGVVEIAVLDSGGKELGRSTLTVTKSDKQTPKNKTKKGAPPALPTGPKGNSG